MSSNLLNAVFILLWSLHGRPLFAGSKGTSPSESCQLLLVGQNATIQIPVEMWEPSKEGRYAVFQRLFTELWLSQADPQATSHPDVLDSSGTILFEELPLNRLSSRLPSGLYLTSLLERTAIAPPQRPTAEILVHLFQRNSRVSQVGRFNSLDSLARALKPYSMGLRLGKFQVSLIDLGSFTYDETPNDQETLSSDSFDTASQQRIKTELIRNGKDLLVRLGLPKSKLILAQAQAGRGFDYSWVISEFSTVEDSIELIDIVD